jgi:hypothetical protein
MPDDVSPFADFLDQRRKEITAEWLRRVRGDRKIPSADDLPREELLRTDGKHLGVRTRKCQNCPVRENPNGTLLGVEREVAPLERLEDTAKGHLVVAPR